jgi:hypothetical protein
MIMQIPRIKTNKSLADDRWPMTGFICDSLL